MTGIRARFAKIAALALAALALTASSGAAASSTAHPGILGVVPHASEAVAPVHNLMSNAAVKAATPATLTFDPSYESLINRYFADVAADNGGTNNVYSVATQYYDNPGQVHIQYQSAFGGAYVDHDPLPTVGCTDGVDAYCLTDLQLQEEIQTALTATGWQGGLDHVFFLLTPEGVGSCEFAGTASNSNPCSTNVFCAYHSAFGTSEEPVIYANEPYEGHVNGCANSLGFPNDVDSDTTINTISHEHNESITDPLGTGWIAADGNEDGDLCAWIFGTNLGTVGGQPYNQLIHGDKYDLQEEYSNPPDSGCIQRPGGAVSPANVSEDLPYGGGPVMLTNTTYAIYWLPTAGNTSLPVVTGTAGVNQTLTTTPGTWSDGPTSYSFQWQRCSVVGTSCANIVGATAATYRLTAADAGHTVRSTVAATNVNGLSQAVDSDFTAAVVGSPVAIRVPAISGRAKVGKRLTASKGSWTGPPQAYRFQWLRCNGRGASCRKIAHAARSRYRLTKKDAGHRLRVRVTASNAVGTKAVLSRATARVAAAKK